MTTAHGPAAKAVVVARVASAGDRARRLDLERVRLGCVPRASALMRRAIRSHSARSTPCGVSTTSDSANDRPARCARTATISMSRNSRSSGSALAARSKASTMPSAIGEVSQTRQKRGTTALLDYPPHTTTPFGRRAMAGRRRGRRGDGALAQRRCAAGWLVAGAPGVPAGDGEGEPGAQGGANSAPLQEPNA